MKENKRDKKERMALRAQHARRLFGEASDEIKKEIYEDLEKEKQDRETKKEAASKDARLSPEEINL